MATTGKRPSRDPPSGSDLLTCFKCQARERSAWCMVSPEELLLLNRAKSTQVYDARQVIFYQGSPCMGIYCIESGTLAVKRIDPRGASHITRLCQAGDTIGYRAYFTDSHFEGTAEAVTECRICFIHRKSVQDLLRHNPNVGFQFLRGLARDLSEVEDRMLAHRSLSVAARLAHLLLVLKDRYDGMDDQGNIILELPFSRVDVADLIGARPESLSRAIRQLEQAGVARFRNRAVIIPDLDVLMDEIEQDRSSDR